MLAKAWANGLLQTRTAIFSDCGLYRYSLSIRLRPGPRLINFLMLNPSTADEQRNDPTVERCERRGTAMGYDQIVITNLFAYRATLPEDMQAAADPVGPNNDDTILGIARKATTVVCAWGTHGGYRGRAAAVLAMLRGDGCGEKLHYLTLCADGNPGHPLYVPYETKPVKWVAT